MVKEGALENPRPSARSLRCTCFLRCRWARSATPRPGAFRSRYLESEDRRQAGPWRQAGTGGRSDRHGNAVRSALQTIRSRTMSGHEPGVVTIGTVHGGQRHNIIPSEVTLTGTIRTFRSDMSKQAEERLRAILKGVTKSAGATGEVVW